MEDEISAREVAEDFLSEEYGPPPVRVTKEKFHDWYSAYVGNLAGFMVPAESSCLTAVRGIKFMRRLPHR
jgi:hypothetical protein